MEQKHGRIYSYLLFTTLFVIGFSYFWLPLSTPVVAAPVPEQTDSAVTWLGSIGGAIQSVAVSGTIAYIGEGAALTVLDVSQPSQPVQIGRLPLPDLVYDIQLVGTQLHLATGYSGVQILDISTPASPLVVAGFDTAGFAYRTVSEGSLLYIADGRAGVVILDIADLDQVEAVGKLAIGEAIVGVQPVNGFLYAWDLNEGLFVVDVAEPKAPVVLGPTPIDIDLRDVDVAGDIAYFTEHARVGKYDVSQPAQPRLLATYELASPQTATIAQDLLFIITYDAMLVFDPKQPPAAGKMGELTIGPPVALWIGNEHAFIASGEALTIIDIHEPTNLTLVGKYLGIDRATALAVVQDTLYLANTEQGIHVIDVTDPEQPTAVAALPFRSGAYDVAAKDGYLYATAGTSGLHVFDLTATITPTLIYTYTALLGAYQLEIAEDIAFVASGPGGLIYLFDSSEPAAPLLRSSIPCTGSCRMVVDLPWLYVTSEQGFDITLVSEPYSPRPYGVYAIENTAVRNPGHIMAHGDYVYLPVGVEPFVDVVDVTSPSDPVLYQRLSMNVGSALQTQEYAFLTSGEALRTTTLYPLETVPRLSAKASFVLPNVAQEIVVVENRMYVADGSAGLQILTLGPTKFVPEIYLPLIAR